MDAYGTMDEPSRRVCAAVFAIFSLLSQTRHEGTARLLEAAAAGTLPLPSLRLRLSSFAERFLRVGAALRGGARFGIEARSEVRAMGRAVRRLATPSAGGGAAQDVPTWLLDARTAHGALTEACCPDGDDGGRFGRPPPTFSACLASLDDAMRDLFATQIAAHVREIAAPFPDASGRGFAVGQTMRVLGGPPAADATPADDAETTGPPSPPSAAPRGPAPPPAPNPRPWLRGADPLTRFVVEHEAVHPFDGPADVRARLGGSADRVAFALLHPHMPQQPLAVVQVALLASPAGFGVPEPRAAAGPGPDTGAGRDRACCVDRLLQDADLGPQSLGRAARRTSRADTALFYSATNCFRDGLQGLQLASLLLFLAQERLTRRFRGITRFVTLSPMPRFRRWVEDCALPAAVAGAEAWPLGGGRLPPGLQRAVAARADGSAVARWAQCERVLRRWAALYLLFEKQPAGGRADPAGGRPVGRARKALDPVLNFHIQNGAVVARVCPAATNKPRVRDAAERERGRCAAPFTAGAETPARHRPASPQPPQRPCRPCPLPTSPTPPPTVPRPAALPRLPGSDGQLPVPRADAAAGRADRLCPLPPRRRRALPRRHAARCGEHWGQPTAAVAAPGLCQRPCGWLCPAPRPGRRRSPARPRPFPDCPPQFGGCDSLPPSLRRAWGKLIFVALSLAPREALRLSEAAGAGPGSLVCVCRGSIRAGGAAVAADGAHTVTSADEHIEAECRTWIVLVSHRDVARAAEAERPSKL